jgi:EAL domain-containing protein (putative c-di-GMP-specific phosphodiesterase class I)
VESNEPVTAESLGWQLRSALPPMRLHSVSLYNVDADVLWLSEGALGPDEHNVVVEAIETQKNDKSPYYEFGMEDGRMAVFLPIRGPRNELAGTVMILVDMKSVTEGTMERIVTPQIRTILVKIAMFMRKNAPAPAQDAAPEVAMPAPAAAPSPPVNVASSTVVEKIPPQAAAALANAAAPTTLGPREVEQILELELVAEAPRAPAADVGTPAAASKGTPAGTALKKNAGGYAAGAKTNARGGTAPAAVAARVAPNLTAVQTMPARDVEVLAFEPDIQIPTARAAIAPPADVEVLAFDMEPPVVSAAPPAIVPVVSAAAPASQVVPVSQPAAAAKPASTTGSTSSVRAINVTASASTASVRSINAAASAATVAASASTGAFPAPGAPAPSTSKPESSSATTTSRAFGGSAALAAAAAAANATATGTTSAIKAASFTAQQNSPASAPSAPAAMPVKADAAPPPRTTKPSPSNTQTAAVQIVSDDDEVPHLISDTGPVPVLAQPVADDMTSIEPAPQLPPLEPLSVEESAADLTLFAQELIKLRSSGRTRRYEVLARSQRDAHRNEVPAAFVAESASGKDGAALDAMVVERLLTWLGQHGETIWDSEPASFSVNLSIGAIEDETFVPRIEQWLAQYNVPAEYIGFEITEFACVQCKPAVQKFVEAIEKVGCFLVIDNFSFDSSIFEMLGSKALRHVKLDPKVTTAAMKDKLPQALVVAILQACKVLGVHCVAKRVESQSTMQWLTAVGCDFAQSFALHKPIPLEALASGQPIKALRE